MTLEKITLSIQCWLLLMCVRVCVVLLDNDTYKIYCRFPEFNDFTIFIVAFNIECARVLHYTSHIRTQYSQYPLGYTSTFAHNHAHSVRDFATQCGVEELRSIKQIVYCDCIGLGSALCRDRTH